MIAFGLTLSLALLGMFQEETEVVLGESWTVEDTGYVNITVFKSRSEGMWDYYALELQFHNKAPRLIQFDKSKIYLVGDSGQPLFDPLDDEQLLDERRKETADVLNRTNILLGKTIEAETRQVRQAVEELKPEQEEPIDIPPGAKVTIVSTFHTPFRPKHLLLSIFGVSVGKDLLELQPVRILVPDNSP